MHRKKTYCFSHSFFKKIQKSCSYKFTLIPDPIKLCLLIKSLSKCFLTNGFSDFTATTGVNFMSCNPELLSAKCRATHLLMSNCSTLRLCSLNLSTGRLKKKDKWSQKNSLFQWLEGLCDQFWHSKVKNHAASLSE